MDLPTKIVVAVVIGFFLFVIGVVLYRHSFGSLKIKAPHKKIGRGISFATSIKLYPRQSFVIESMSASLICNYVYRIHKGDGKYETKYEEVYRETKEIEGPFNTIRGRIKIYDFSFKTPMTIPHPKALMMSIAPIINLRFMRFIKKQAIRDKSKYQWSIHAQIKAQRVTLDKYQSVHIDIFPDQ